MHEKERREQVFAQLPEALGRAAHALVAALGALEQDIWALTRVIDARLDSEAPGSMALLSDWVAAATALAARNATLLKQGEALVGACVAGDLPEALVVAVRDRVAPFLEDIAEAQQQYREAAQRAAGRGFTSPGLGR